MALGELALVFLRLGATAFGGPAAHLAMMEDEFVRRRAWMTREELLDRIGAASLLPGPTSTEVALLVGHRRAGLPGLVVAGVCFIAPSAILVTALAWAYVRYGGLHGAEGVLAGLKAAVLAVVVQALVAFARTVLRPPHAYSRGVIGFVALAATLAPGGVSPVVVLLGGGVASLVARRAAHERRDGAALFLPGVLGASAVVSPLVPASVGKVFLAFLEIGSVVFGSGYVLLAFLRADLVVDRRWITEPELLDAIAVGQFTPGPVFTTATFVGYLVGRLPGAFAATVGIFLPAFVLAAASGPLVARLRASPRAGAFLDGVNAASLALLALVATQLARAAVVDVGTAAIAAASLVALLRYRVSSAWLVLAGGLVGAGLQALR